MAKTEEEKRKANREAVARYDAKNDRINCRFPSGTVDRIKKLGYASANSFILQAVFDRLEKEEERAKTITPYKAHTPHIEYINNPSK